ncbi:MAG: hypothetical protein A2Y33_11040 [Spirochaetes bacterium GWF1_51_8]|nr:MAG: hypothetical protein A2Y33_11040 [Spirochaetes bacterium GWF1_51_8]
MPIIIFASLSLYAIGIFFIPLWILAPITLLLIVAVLIADPAKFVRLSRQILFLTLFLAPLFIIKTLLHNQGEFYRIGMFVLYRDGMIEAGMASLRVVSLFCAVFLVLKIMFPFEKYRKRYAKVKVLAAVFMAMEMFPEILSEIKASLAVNKAKSEKGFAALLDTLYERSIERSGKE